MKTEPETMSYRRLSQGLAAVVLSLLAWQAPADSVLDPATVTARKEKSDPSWNFLSYQHMDKLFDTRTVAAGETVWELPRSKRSLGRDFAVDVNETRISLEQALIDMRVNALLVLKDGEIVSEIYRHGSSRETRFIAMSMSKSIISILYGLAIEDGYIDGIDDPILRYLPELEGTAYEKVTIRNLLMMRSGVDWNEGGSELAERRTLALDEEKAYYEDFAFEARRAVEPGSKFNYSTLDANVLGWALSRAVGRNLSDYMSSRLWQPAGMEFSGYWTMQGPGGKQREFYGAGFNATLRDYGRVGQMMLDGGMANAAQVVPPAWVEESTDRGTPPKPYMYQWWGTASPTAYAALGYRGQQVYVDPATNLVIVVLSYFKEQQEPGTAPLVQAIARALENQS